MKHISRFAEAKRTKRHYKTDLVMFKIIQKAEENIEHLLVKMALFRLHHFLEPEFRGTL